MNLHLRQSEDFSSNKNAVKLAKDFQIEKRNQLSRLSVDVAQSKARVHDALNLGDRRDHLNNWEAEMQPYTKNANDHVQKIHRSMQK